MSETGGWSVSANVSLRVNWSGLQFYVVKLAGRRI